HVPINRPVRLTIISQDVMHSYAIPAFRIKREAVPGRYTSVWFEATQTGTFHIFCTQYCGTKHSAMIGEVTTMEPAEYEKWLAGAAGEGSLAAGGEKLFQSMGCNTCHRGDSGARGPNLAGLYNSTVHLNDGHTVIADDAYLRESILQPTAKMTQEHYLNEDYSLKSWLLTTDHKRIAILYLISISFAFLLGGIFATLIRLELLTPQGDLFESDTYNKLFSEHGIIMVFFFLVP